MNNYSINTKITWQVKIENDWESTFYPSLVKKIRKSDEYFNDLFEFKVNSIENIDVANDFFDLYEREIASRANYVYEKGEQKRILENNIHEGVKYALGGCYKKNTNELVGGIIFSIRESKFSSALRVFSSSARSTYRSQTTIDFWTEKEFYKYIKSQDINILTHGTDNYPNIGRIGLPLFKLKVGGHPRIAKKKHEVITLSDSELLQRDEPTLFFDKPDEDGFFTTCHLFYKEGKIDESVLGELKKVLEWSDLEFITNS